VAKDKTPPPPRKVQAPKVRTDRKERRERSPRLILAVVGGAIVVALAVGGIVFAATRESGGALASGVCEVTTYPGQGQQHVPPAEINLSTFKYNSWPPTTGPHNPQPAVFGEYTDPVPFENYVHNQEHGGVTIQYGSKVPGDVVQRLTAWYRTDPRGLILAPLPTSGKAAGLQNEIVITAWTAERENPNDPGSRITKQEGHLARCSTFDEGAFSSFVDRYRAKGPEPFRLDDLMPGGS
jgi:hypothetical protein